MDRQSQYEWAGGLTMKHYNCVAVITGGASGIGYGLAKECISRNMNVVLTDIDSVALEKATNSLRGEESRCTSLRTDVAKEPDVRALATCANSTSSMPE